MSGCPNLVLESLGIPREQLVLSLHWNHEEVCSNTSDRMPQQEAGE